MSNQFHEKVILILSLVDIILYILITGVCILHTVHIYFGFGYGANVRHWGMECYQRNKHVCVEIFLNVFRKTCINNAGFSIAQTLLFYSCVHN